jgi:hypothetical protein
MTTTTSLVTLLKSLSRSEKLSLIQFLVSDLAHEEGVIPLNEEHVYQGLLPYESYEAAHKLEQFLIEHKNSKNP